MSKVSKSAHKASFVQRVQTARERRGMSQEEMAAALAVAKSPYAKYETRSLMPHHMVPTFLAITGASWEWLFTGIGKPPAIHEDAVRSGYATAADAGQRAKVS